MTEIKFNLPDDAHSDPTVTMIGDIIVFAGIHTDVGSENPCTASDGFGMIRSLSSNHVNSIGREELENLCAADVVILSYSEHGACKWYVQGTGVHACSWDTTTFGGVWVPDECILECAKTYAGGEDQPTREEWLRTQAESACEIYTEWANGRVYLRYIEAYRHRTSDSGKVYDELTDYRFETAVYEDTCGGHYGFDVALEALEEELQAYANIEESETPDRLLPTHLLHTHPARETGLQLESEHVIVDWADWQKVVRLLVKDGVIPHNKT